MTERNQLFEMFISLAQVKCEMKIGDQILHYETGKGFGLSDCGFSHIQRSFRDIAEVKDHLTVLALNELEKKFVNVELISDVPNNKYKVVGHWGNKRMPMITQWHSSRIDALTEAVRSTTETHNPYNPNPM